MKTIQNFYKSTLSLDWSIGTGTFYVTTKPTITEGWLVISPNNSTIREIVRYTSTGTDSNGDYVVVSIRGVGGTTEQIHTVGEPIRMNITAEYWKDMTDAIDSIVAAGAPNADTTTKGLVEIATDAEVIAGTNTGATGASLVATPGQIKTSIELRALPLDIQTFTSSGTWTKPTGAKTVNVLLWGAGGSGASTNSTAGGGGGGAFVDITFPAASCGTTETVTLGDGGTTVTNSAGNAGGNSSFGSLCIAYGGAGGQTTSGGGGGGNGSAGSGATGGGILGGSAGSSSAGGSSSFGGGGGGNGTNIGGSSTYGGAGGGSASGGNGAVGGNSIYGGAGGGSTGSGTINGGTSKLGGNGGNGSPDTPTAGAVPGGGGGGVFAAYASGAGGKGKAIITTYF